MLVWYFFWRDTLWAGNPVGFIRLTLVSIIPMGDYRMKIKFCVFLILLICNTFSPNFSMSETIQKKEETIYKNNSPTLTTGGLVTENQMVKDPSINLEEQIINLIREVQYLKSDRYKTEEQYHKKYYEHLEKKLDINLSGFEWQQKAANYLMFLVVIVVLTGLVFSGYQIWKASRIKDFGESSSIELSVQKIKITSSVVGIIVLTISIAFFYLFLIEVYRVKLVG